MDAVGIAKVAKRPEPGDGDGYGYGDGDGSGYGDGYGDGSGSGYGYGSGYGDGYGYGSGYGSGDGDGSGDGYGDGDGYGYGYGSGSGDGYGSGSGDGYWPEALAAFTEHELVLNATKNGDNVVIALWRSDAAGRASNGGSSKTAAVPGLIEEVPGPLKVCTKNALHASIAPEEWSGDRWWVVALFEPVQWEGNKLGSLKRLVVAELGAPSVSQEHTA